MVVVAGCGGSRASSDGSTETDAPDFATPSDPTPPDLGLAADGGADDGGTHEGDGGVIAVPNGTATISGVINGYQVVPVRSVVAVVTAQSFEVYISDRADLCTIMQSGPGSGTGGGSGGGGSGGGGGGGTGMGTRDAVIMSTADNCIFDGYNQASTGSFTITTPVAPNATEIDGTFDITFDVITDMGRFTGTFKAPVCPNATNVPETPIYCE